MYIIVRTEDNVIVGFVNGNVDAKELKDRERRIFEIDESDFDINLIGQKLEEYKIID